LLFQVLRDDFISIVVRGCWLVSFFFTPIYMFILCFIVMFGIKKGSVTTYRATWASLVTQQLFTLLATKIERRVQDCPNGFLTLYKTYAQNNAVHNKSQQQAIKLIPRLHLYKFHYTTITSRKTSYFLFFFWLFFFFFGESLLLVLFNFTTPLDAVTSHSFFIIKQHVIFLTNSMSSQLVMSINFYIYLLTLCSFIYLLNLNFIVNYNFFKQVSVVTMLPLFVLIVFTG
jgi:hypothetical protein